MKKTVLALTLAGLFLSPTVWSATSGITLDGHSLTLEDAWEIAYSNKEVHIAPAAMKKVEEANQLLMTAASKGIPVYGCPRKTHTRSHCRIKSLQR